jgi:hypothetical protein
MSTSFSSPFNKFLSLITDRDLSVNLTDEQMTDLLNTFLNQSSSLYFKNCAVDLSDIENPDYLSEEFTATGTSADFVISRYPTSPNADSIELICQVDGGDVGYTFDAITKTFTLTSTPTAGHTVTCGYNFIGQFNLDLTDQMCWILAYGALVSWYQQKLFNASLFKNKLNTKDFNSFSSANLLDKLAVLNDIAEKKLHNLIVSYSFDSGHNFDE